MTEGLLEQYDSLPTYEEALDTISSLITKRIRADGTNKGDQFDLMLAYLKILELEDSLSRLKVIHVAGTKGKGSTCTFTESILRACGFHTGLFTSPHLIDLRERFQIDGVEISEEIFLAYFWWCWNRLKEKTNDDVPMPTYFRFLALLAFKIFAAEQVDVAILEVGLGGKFDATNVVQSPVVCGISSLGFDHMEILGNTLGEIAGEKAGIFKRGVPAFTAPQLEEAMSVLQIKASQLDVPLQIAPPLDSMPDGIQLGLAGEHQYINAGLAVALCRTWLQRTEHLKGLCLYETSGLPEQFVKGLATASLQGRAQIVPDPHMGMENKSDRGESRCSLGELIFYLDGAHSPESTDVCARWFSHAVQKDLIPQSCQFEHITRESSGKNSKQILLFNCMSVRDPLLLLPHLKNTCALNGIHFHKAIFVPNQSVFNKVGSHALPSTDPLEVDLSWQLTLQKVWEDLTHGDIGASGNRTMDSCSEEKRETEPYIINVRENSSVFASLPLALKWLRETAQRDQSTHFQVLVTGSLHLVGDMLRLIKK